jgi:hypothetical protein
MKQRNRGRLLDVSGVSDPSSDRSRPALSGSHSADMVSVNDRNRMLLLGLGFVGCFLIFAVLFAVGGMFILGESVTAAVNLGADQRSFPSLASMVWFSSLFVFPLGAFVLRHQFRTDIGLLAFALWPLLCLLICFSLLSS